MSKNCWLNDKTVIVTGASGGMGAGIAKTLISVTYLLCPLLLYPYLFYRQ